MPYATTKFLKRRATAFRHQESERNTVLDPIGSTLWGYAYFEDTLFFPAPDALETRKPFSVANITIRHESADANSIAVYSERFECHNGHLIDELHILLELRADLFIALVEAEKKGEQLEFSFRVENHKRGSREIIAECNLLQVDVYSANHRPDEWFAKRIAKQIESNLFSELCGDQSRGQVPKICSELANHFQTEQFFENRRDLLPQVAELISDVRKIFERERERSTQTVESAIETVSQDIFLLAGAEFRNKLSQIYDLDVRKKTLSDYNELAKQLDIPASLKNGLPISTSSIEWVVQSYLEIKGVRSNLLESLFIERLLASDLIDVANDFLINHNFPPGAIASLHKPYYDREIFTAKGKSSWSFIPELTGKVMLKLATFLLGGLITWWWTSLIAGNNETGHYILFGTIFAAGLIVKGVSQKDPEAISLIREESTFCLLKDFYSLIFRVPAMNVNLITKLMYDLEVRGVRFNQHVYKLLASHQESHKTS